MEIDENDIIEDLRPYYSVSVGARIIEELFFNAYRTIQSVYLFQHFEVYKNQLISDISEDKTEVFWKASYHEKLIDLIKISVAFENFNKAVLLQSGYLVHKIIKTEATKELFNKQNKGLPIRIEKFREVSELKRNGRFGKYYFHGLSPLLSTISYSTTLNEKHQDIIDLDKALLLGLKEINEMRNRLHFFIEFRGAYRVDTYIQKWEQIKELSIKTLTKKLNKR